MQALTVSLSQYKVNDPHLHVDLQYTDAIGTQQCLWALNSTADHGHDERCAVRCSHSLWKDAFCMQNSLSSCLLFRFTHRMGRRIYVRRSPLLYQVSWRFISWRKEDISLSPACLTAAVAAVISDRRPLSHTHTYHSVSRNASARTLKAYTSR